MPPVAMPAAFFMANAVAAFQPYFNPAELRDWPTIKPQVLLLWTTY
jgi:hypothetical protein